MVDWPMFSAILHGLRAAINFLSVGKVNSFLLLVLVCGVAFLIYSYSQAPTPPENWEAAAEKLTATTTSLEKTAEMLVSVIEKLDTGRFRDSGCFSLTIDEGKIGMLKGILDEKTTSVVKAIENHANHNCPQ